MGLKKTNRFEILHNNVHGFNEGKVNEVFSGGLTYLCDRAIGSNYSPSAIFKCAKPDRTKDHKKYAFLTPHVSSSGTQWYISGTEVLPPEISKATLALCVKCDSAIYSSYRHDYVRCKCGEVFIDGGTDYTRTNAVTVVGDISKKYYKLTTDTIKVIKNSKKVVRK